MSFKVQVQSLIITQIIIPNYSIPHFVTSQTFLVFLWKWRYTTSKYLGKPEALQRKRELCFLPIAISRQFLLPLIPKDADPLQNLSSNYVTFFPYCHYLSIFRSLSPYYLKILKAHLLSSHHSCINFCDFSFYMDDSSNNYLGYTGMALLSHKVANYTSNILRRFQTLPKWPNHFTVFTSSIWGFRFLHSLINPYHYFCILL